jgi:hypothetical protein
MDIETRTGLYERKARLSQRRDKLQQSQEKKARTQRKLEKARRDVKTASERWNSWDLEEKRTFIHVATDSITLEEIAAGWLKISVQWGAVLGGLLYDFYLWRDSGIQWTDEEEAILRQHYPTAKRTDLLNMLPARSWRAINGMAWRLKLRRIAKSDPLPIPDTMSRSDVYVLLSLTNELTESEIRGETNERFSFHTEEGDTIEIDRKQLYVHISQASDYDIGTRPRNCMVESPRHG